MNINRCPRCGTIDSIEPCPVGPDEKLFYCLDCLWNLDADYSEDWGAATAQLHEAYSTYAPKCRKEKSAEEKERMAQEMIAKVEAPEVE